MEQRKKVILTILDGWGIGDKSKADAISQGSTPNIDAATAKYPHSQLLTSGEDVGLPDGQMGNSEVGHLNIGSGRVVYQDLVRINKAIEDNSIMDNEAIKKAFGTAKENNCKLHLIGLVSDGGVHSSQEHLHKLCDISEAYGLKQTYIHAISDGRDTDPKSGLAYMQKLEQHIANTDVKLGTLIGRYYAMDRDKRWERIEKAYRLYTQNEGEASHLFSKSMEEAYKNELTDEFLTAFYNPDYNSCIEDGDVVICFNFRTDRLRQLTTVLSQSEEAGMKPLALNYFTMTNYDDSFKNVNIIYNKENLKQTLGEVIEQEGKHQLRIAETEKYAHVTFFFSGGREANFKNEERILVPSPKVATYDLQPEMSALIVKDKLVEAVNSEQFDLIVVNFANGDMVGHTGIYPAILKAVETVDTCVGQLMEAAINHEYEMIIIADHGNSDFAINENNTPNTAHSLNPVPFILISDRYQSVQNGILADVAPTILDLMDIKQPEAMSGHSLINHQ